jgi:hypothetical protein
VCLPPWRLVEESKKFYFAAVQIGKGMIGGSVNTFIKFFGLPCTVMYVK